MSASNPRTNLLSRWAERVGNTCAAPTAQALNDGCFCVSVDEQKLDAALRDELGSPELLALLRERCPHLFAARPVFVDHAHVGAMQGLVTAIGSVVALPAYREEVLKRSPVIASHDPRGAAGVFFGFDFHAAGESFGLIEINTNAGGAMLNAALARAHRACCPPVEALGLAQGGAQAFEAAIVAMFAREWQRAAMGRELTTVAIVDESPQEQYLYPEFLLFRRLFERAGWQVVIADPKEFAYRDGTLFSGDTRIDLVYNRLTDFYLQTPSSEAIRKAYEQGAIVLTPHPQAHALYADKRNLAILSDGDRLRELGVPADTARILLEGIPRTVIVDALNATQLWSERRRFFFKPFAGFGSRATYRGDKLTQRVWQEILAGGYVAQALVAPGQRTLESTDDKPLKFDLRDYVYDGSVQWVAARLYQGQTTNFRTPGGGFAPVYEAPCRFSIDG